MVGQQVEMFLQVDILVEELFIRHSIGSFFAEVFINGPSFLDKRTSTLQASTTGLWLRITVISFFKVLW